MPAIPLLSALSLEKSTSFSTLTVAPTAPGGTECQDGLEEDEG